MKQDTTLFGIRAIIEAIKAGKDIEKLMVKRDQDNLLTRELLMEARKAEVPIQYVPLEKINYLCKQNHQGAIALVSQIEYQHIENIIPMLFEQGKTPFVIILDQVTDVRNFGAICRSAECAGVDAIVVSAKGAAPVNADAIKTSAGALNSIPVCRSANLDATVKFLKQSGLTVAAITEKSDTLYYGCTMTGPMALIVGSEETGIAPALLRSADELVKIPMHGTIASLNASVAASIIMYEVVRQRAL